jgi:hypothetical protein
MARISLRVLLASLALFTLFSPPSAAFAVPPDAVSRGRIASTTARLCGSEVEATAAAPITLSVPLQGSGETAYVLRVGNLTRARFADCVSIEARSGGFVCARARAPRRHTLT